MPEVSLINMFTFTYSKINKNTIIPGPEVSSRACAERCARKFFVPQGRDREFIIYFITIILLCLRFLFHEYPYIYFIYILDGRKVPKMMLISGVHLPSRVHFRSSDCDERDVRRHRLHHLRLILHHGEMNTNWGEYPSVESSSLSNISESSDSPMVD